MPTYVILHHQPAIGSALPRGTNAHFDWMFDHGQALWTWATDILADSATRGDWLGEATTTAIRLPDHRRAYLTFEGPLSGDRGHVRRVESGSFEVLRADLDHYEFAVTGGRQGIVAFQRTRSVLNGNCEDVWYWSFRPVRADAS
ncbi:MAG: hypothetical protein ACO1RT_21135 [Planctomycetaceae bacterium]